MSTDKPFQQLRGVMTAVVTPMKADGSVDHDGLRALVDDQLSAGIHGIVACGTTGEAATLSVEERLDVVRTCIEHVDGRAPVIAGAGSNDTREAVELQKRMTAAGVDATLQVTPWYNKPTQDGLYAHFAAIAEADDTPIVLYNVPGRCSIDMLPATVERLARDFKHIVAVKEATGSASRAEEIITRVRAFRDDFSVLSGDDGLILALLAIGGQGVISVISHVCPEDLVQMYEAFSQGELSKATKLSHKVRALTPTLFFRSNPIPTKAALAEGRLRGKMEAHVRLPLVPLNDDDNKTLHTLLNDAGYPLTEG